MMMEVLNKLKSKNHLTLIFFLLFLLQSVAYAQDDVTVSISESSLSSEISNGIVKIKTNSKGHATLLELNGKDLLNSSAGGRLYFSLNDQNTYAELSPSKIEIVKQTDDYAEVVYSRTSGDLIIDQGYILRKGVSGVYSYIVIKGTSTDISLREMRVVYRVDPNMFNYGFITEDMQGLLPTVAVMKEVDKSSIMDATYPLPDGSIYTKYDWAHYIDKDSVHGIMSDNYGLWAISPSNEYANGGPMKQELTVHATNKTPLVLQMLQGEHFGASATKFTNGDKKIYGPFFIYLNSGDSHEEMIANARNQASIQREQWPFQWFDHPLYPKNRTTVKGKIKLPSYYEKDGIKVVLAQPGTPMYEQGKDYMFWSETNINGDFEIKNVREGSYSLYAYATKGEITDELEVKNIIANGEIMNLGDLEWIPKKYSHKLLQIGENNRLADGYKYSDFSRQYGLYELPPADMTFIDGVTEENEGWYYAQTKNGTWTIQFENEESLSGAAHLTASIAGAANSPKVAINVNGTNVGTWSFTNDASVYRSAVLGGKHQVKTQMFAASYLKKGTNTIKLTMSNVGNRGGVMYDCIKLEAGTLDTTMDINPIDNRLNSISVFPNPFNDILNVKIAINIASSVKIEIFNMQGNRVKYDDYYHHPGNHQVEVNTTELPKGVYFYKITLDSQVFSGTIVK